MRWFPVVAGLAILSLTACVSVPKDAARALAKSGADTSDLAAREVRDLSGRLDRVEEFNVFTSTWETCAAAPGQPCEPEQQSPDNAQATEELILIINRRGAALSALGDAYRALSVEADYDAEGQLEGAVGTLTASVNAYADLVQPGSGTLIGGPLGTAITHGAGFWAREQQRQRLIAGSIRIRQALDKMRSALAGEIRLYSDLSKTFAGQEGATLEALYEAGLILRAPLLAPLAADMGVTLAPGAEQVLASNLNARTATQAYVRARANDSIRLQAQRYDAILRAFGKLAQAHADFEQARSPDMADLERAVVEITALIPDTKEDVE